MAQLFSYWHCEPGRGINCMRPILLSLVLMSSFVDGQAQAAPDKIKADVKSVQNAVNDAVGAALPGWGVLQAAKDAAAKRAAEAMTKASSPTAKPSAKPASADDHDEDDVQDADGESHTDAAQTMGGTQPNLFG